MPITHIICVTVRSKLKSLMKIILRFDVLTLGLNEKLQLSAKLDLPVPILFVIRA